MTNNTHEAHRIAAGSAALSIIIIICSERKNKNQYFNNSQKVNTVAAGSAAFISEERELPLGYYKVEKLSRACPAEPH